MTPAQILHAKRVNSNPAAVVADYMTRRQWDSVAVALAETADYWGVEVEGLAVYLRSRAPDDAEVLKQYFPFLGAHYLGDA